MAQKTIITLEDDLNGSAADETLNFSFDDTNYEIDLNTSNADKMREALAPYLAAARKTQPRPRKTGAAKTSSGPAAKDVRAWAAGQNIPVNPFGRVSQAAIDAYTAAH